MFLERIRRREIRGEITTLCHQLPPSMGRESWLALEALGLLPSSLRKQMRGRPQDRTLKLSLLSAHTCWWFWGRSARRMGKDSAQGNFLTHTMLSSVRE